jgi:hypothetical protein
MAAFARAFLCSGIAALLAMAMLPLEVWAQQQAAVVTRNVNLRSDPSTSQPRIELLKPPTTLEVLDPNLQSGYLHVRSSDGTEGWVWARNVEVGPAPTPVAEGVASQIDANWGKPAPQSADFTLNGKTCGPTGDGGDADTNERKNRTDVPSAYHDITFDAIASLAYPVAAKSRADWTADQLAQIAPYEGTSVRVIGYLAAVKPQTGGSGESTNCHWTQADEVDWHVALVSQAGQGEPTAVVVETTPRIRLNHPGWKPESLAPWVKSDQPVRISGWVMLDPEHRNHLNKYRATLWEIHPITEIEVQQNGVWVPLDNVQ